MGIKDLENTYRGKRIFVTGHTGFKGGWLIAILTKLGAHVKGYALKAENTGGVYTLLETNHWVTESIIADIRSKQTLHQEIENFQPDFIFHLAAQPLVRRSYDIPAETFEVNVAGTANVLEAVINLMNKCAIVIVTTDKVYDNKENGILYKETDALGGYDPYSASKACTELVVNSFRNSFFSIPKYSHHQKALASARAGNVIGGGDWNTDRIIPDIIRSLQNGQAVKVRNPKSVRPWQHVLEPLTGYLLLGASLYNDPNTYSQAFNFGPRPDDHLTVAELVQQAIKTWGSGIWSDSSDANQPHEASLLQLDITKAESVLCWSPKLTSDQAIEWTVDWYKKADNEKLNYTFEQIDRFFLL